MRLLQVRIVIISSVDLKVLIYVSKRQNLINASARIVIASRGQVPVVHNVTRVTRSRPQGALNDGKYNIRLRNHIIYHTLSR